MSLVNVSIWLKPPLQPLQAGPVLPLRTGLLGPGPNQVSTEIHAGSCSNLYSLMVCLPKTFFLKLTGNLQTIHNQGILTRALLHPHNAELSYSIATILQAGYIQHNLKAEAF